MFEALAEAEINIQMITTSEIKISVLVDRAAGRRGLAGRAPGVRAGPGPPRRVAAASPRRAGDRADPAVAVADLGGARRPTRGRDGGPGRSPASSSTSSQARVTLLDVPDQPGYAAQVFRAIAEAGVFVDMIVQNVRTPPATPELSFTVPRPDAERAAEAASAAVGRPGDVLVEPSLAKLSVIGVGMRTHTGVANRMFGALAEAGINIGLISTSEVRVNVLTDLDHGQKGLECLKRAFPLPSEG